MCLNETCASISGKHDEFVVLNLFVVSELFKGHSIQVHHHHQHPIGGLTGRSAAIPSRAPSADRRQASCRQPRFAAASLGLPPLPHVQLGLLGRFGLALDRKSDQESNPRGGKPQAIFSVFASPAPDLRVSRCVGSKQEE